MGSAQNLKSNARFPVPTAQQQSSLLFQELGLVRSLVGVCNPPWVCATNAFLDFVAKELHEEEKSK